MHKVETQPDLKRRTNLSISEGLLDEAKLLGINLSRSAESGIAEAISKAKHARWLADNQAAIASSNDFVEKHGVPLSKYRQF